MHQRKFQQRAEVGCALAPGVIQEMIHNVVGKTAFGVELYYLTDSAGIQIVEIPSGNLSLCCLDEYSLQIPVGRQSIGLLQEPAQRKFVVVGSQRRSGAG